MDLRFVERDVRIFEDGIGVERTLKILQYRHDNDKLWRDVPFVRPEDEELERLARKVGA